MRKCIICGNKEFRILYSETLKQCLSCGFATANMEIGKDHLGKTYSKNYFFGEEYLDYIQDKEILQLNFEKRLHYINANILKDQPVNNCLEIGCAYGFFGEVLIKHWNTLYKGIDVVSEAVHYGKDMLGLNTVLADYLRLPPPDEPYSDVFMWDVIEHLQYPDKFLEKISQEIVSGGRIYITTGDFSSMLSKLQGKRWRMIHPPSHIHYFSKGNLIKLLNTYKFKVSDTKYFPVYRSVQQALYSLFVLNKSNNIIGKALNLIPSKWCFAINTYDIVFIAAIKQ